MGKRGMERSYRQEGRSAASGRRIVYLVCILILVLCIGLDVYFILGILDYIK
ncbi:MAG: hypothetical protein II167_03800 [Clostridiales bacterium]|nr:hypothetical protein [Clostridiales bacterium]